MVLITNIFFSFSFRVIIHLNQAQVLSCMAASATQLAMHIWTLVRHLGVDRRLNCKKKMNRNQNEFIFLVIYIDIYKYSICTVLVCNLCPPVQKSLDVYRLYVNVILFLNNLVCIVILFLVTQFVIKTLVWVCLIKFFNSDFVRYLVWFNNLVSHILLWKMLIHLYRSRTSVFIQKL